MMMKFRVTKDLEYVSGYLRYGHLEGVVEVKSQEELDELIENGSIAEYLKVVVDDFTVDDYAESDEAVEYTLVEE